MISEKYAYEVYGLFVESDIELKEFCKAETANKVDKVSINKTIMPDRIKSRVRDGINMSFNKDEVWLNIDNIAIYQICNGNEINFEPYENADMTILKIYLTCSCLGFILLQREKVAIHGGGVIINNKSVIITGERGAGKSTLTTALRLKGYKFLADDIVGINEQDKVVADFGFPYQKLCTDVMDNFEYDKSQYESFMGDTQIKYMIPVYNDFYKQNIEISSIFEINCKDIEDVQVEEITGSEKLQRIIFNIYRGEYLQTMGCISNRYMKKCLKIAKSIKYYKIYRPDKKFCVNEEICAIENILLN